MKFICNKIAGISSTIAFAILCLAQPANALIFNWQFTNEDGTFGSPTDIVAGEVEFDDADVFSGATGVAATRFEITSVTGLNSSSAPLFGDGAIELNTNLITDPGILVLRNNFDFDENGFEDFEFAAGGDLISEEIQIYYEILEGGAIISGTSFLKDDLNLDDYEDIDSSTLSFSQQGSASVPFEFSPTLGLLLVGGVFVSSGYIKHRKAVIK